ncbi:MAG: TRAP transporter small permease [Desulfitobacteriaceae bacterium]|nr:TRAP transporter small permease [Desulfitobacteriaceae bacterium]MDI6880449.1 TRAP transporter small permease [Desulfitobacteriaceae bacterium]MDI6913178.1 TRAP transporter small permease [Desulfitobacteriaceae bacterium]
MPQPSQVTQTWKQGLRKFVHGVERIVEGVGSYMMGIMVAIVIYQVFGRYVLHKTPGWSEEVALLFMTAYGFLSIATGFGRRSHLSVTLLYGHFPAPIRRVLDYFSDILIVLFGVFLFIEGYKFTQLTWSSDLPATGLPNGLQYLVVPITGVVIVIYGLFWLLVGEEEKE